MILEHIRSDAGRANLDGDSVRVTGVRLRSFAEHGVTCVTCGLVGTFFAKEKGGNDTRFHLNLYAIDENGKEVLMTRDHIIPRSKGGSEGIENMQTMCSRCNGKKADKLPVKP
jgi:5-methylcytosine-specific restriction endonuclease McrA